MNLFFECNNLPPCLSLDPPCAPNPRTSETVTPRIPIFSKAFSNYENRQSQGLVGFSLVTTDLYDLVVMSFIFF